MVFGNGFDVFTFARNVVLGSAIISALLAFLYRDKLSGWIANDLEVFRAVRGRVFPSREEALEWFRRNQRLVAAVFLVMSFGVVLTTLGLNNLMREVNGKPSLIPSIIFKAMTTLWAASLFIIPAVAKWSAEDGKVGSRNYPLLRIPAWLSDFGALRVTQRRGGNK